jgi:hypothetical protein
MRATAQTLWAEVRLDVRDALDRHATELTRQTTEALKGAFKEARVEARELYAERLREVERALRENTMQKLAGEIEQLQAELRQAYLFEDGSRRLKELLLLNKEEELDRRRTRYGALKEVLQTEQHRVLDEQLPRRFALHGTVQVFPVAVEIRLPENRR